MPATTKHVCYVPERCAGSEGTRSGQRVASLKPKVRAWVIIVCGVGGLGPIATRLSRTQRVDYSRIASASSNAREQWSPGTTSARFERAAWFGLKRLTLLAECDGWWEQGGQCKGPQGKVTRRMMNLRPLSRPLAQCARLEAPNGTSACVADFRERPTAWQSRLWLVPVEGCCRQPPRIAADDESPTMAMTQQARSFRRGRTTSILSVCV